MATKTRAVAVREAGATTVAEKLSRGEAELKKRLGEAHFGICRAGQELLDQEKYAVVETRYKLGQLLLDALKAGQVNGADGDLAVGEAWGLTRSTIADLRLVASRIGPEEFGRFQRQRSKRGELLEWTYLINLAGVGDPKERRQMLAETVEKGWSAAELDEQIRLRAGSRLLLGQREGAGRPFSVPKSLPSYLKRFDDRARHFNSFLEQVAEAHFQTLVIETPPDKVDQAVLDDMATLEEHLAVVAVRAAAQREQVAKTRAALIQSKGLSAPKAEKAAPAVKPKSSGLRRIPAGRRRASPAPRRRPK